MSGRLRISAVSRCSSRFRRLLVRWVRVRLTSPAGRLLGRGEFALVRLAFRGGDPHACTDVGHVGEGAVAFSA